MRVTHLFIGERQRGGGFEEILCVEGNERTISMYGSMPLRTIGRRKGE